MVILKSLHKINNTAKQISILVFVVLFANAGLASVSTSDLSDDQVLLEQQRQLYKQAIKAYSQKKYQLFKKYTNELHDYPLYPYLQARLLKRNPSVNHINEITDFLNQYTHTPVGQRLRNQLLKRMARQKHWKEFLLLYQPQSSAKLECLYLKALYKEGFIIPAFQQVPKLWTVGKSQPSECDYIFRQFKEAGKLTKDLLWERIELAMDNGKAQLAKFIGKDFLGDDAIWLKLWINSHYKPERLYKSKLLDQHHNKRHAIVAHAIERLAKKDPQKAIALLEFIKNKTGIPYDDEISLFKTIGLTMARRHHADAEIWLNKIPDDFATLDIIQWKIQHGIRRANWSTVISQIEYLPVNHRQKIRWQFWWAYAHKQLGHEIESEETLKLLASKRDYYGFLAADLINLPYQFENNPIKVNPALTEQISSLDGIIRAREFYYLGQMPNARREWNSAVADLSDDALLTAAKIAYHWGWYDRAIAAIGKTENLNDIEIRFPLAYKDIIDNYSDKSDIDSSWTYAIIRRESIFIKDARSSKGALGLMQLMPRTARATARAIKTRYRGKRQLIKTKPNILLGTQYLKQLFTKHNQQTVLATAAYNAGPGNVRRWLPDNKPMDAIRWIESIPYKETREYVTNVLAYKIIYQYRMGHEDITLLSQLMPPVPARI